MIAIIDYGMGNLRSVEKAFELFYPKVKITSSPDEILASDKVVLPGVGAFGKAMDELRNRCLTDAVKDVIKAGKPFLGICLGLQLLFSESEEGGNVKGLDILKGKVRKFGDMKGLKIPHMGWNEINPKIETRKSKILDEIEAGSFMYFVHSYYVDPEDKEVILCETDYGKSFASGIHKDNIYAFQFHPEKSQTRGLKIIENFVKI
jgi:imidazole glycerol-phosphate synthase subunit HisH